MTRRRTAAPRSCWSWASRAPARRRLAEAYLARGYLRLNRDERGGTLRELADELERRLDAGARRVVLDNTYLTRAARSYVIETAARHGVRTRCVWLDTPLAQAQVNLVERLLERFGVAAQPRRSCARWLGASRARSPRPSRCARCASSSRPSTDEGFVDRGA